MLSAQAAAITAEPDGRSAPEVSLDARVRRCRVGTTGNRGPFRRHTGLIVPFGDGHQGYSTPKSTSASYLSGECRSRLNRAGWLVGGYRHPLLEFPTEALWYTVAETTFVAGLRSTRPEA